MKPVLKILRNRFQNSTPVSRRDKNCKEVEILGITIDRNLNFKGHIKNICRKAGQKLSALLRISSHINTDKKVLLYKSMLKY